MPTNTLFMVEPVNFSYNEQTAVNNEFQIKNNDNNVQEKALDEFKNYVKKIRDNDVNVVVSKDTNTPITPDSIFPNNWFSTHSDGTLVLYPMFAQNRRNERKKEFIDTIYNNFKVNKILDLTSYENQNLFLEGTGSMVLDRDNKIAYACLSKRTSEKVLDEFCKEMNYKKIIFNACDRNNKPIYHTNVCMSVGTEFAIVCLESINDELEKEILINSLKQTNKEIIDIKYEQLENFCANVLEIKNRNNDKLLLMSNTAYNSFTNKQLETINKYCKIINVDISTIEKNGGGSARCMVSEIYN